MHVNASVEYICAGGNRHPSAADWDASGLLCFAAGRNLALWYPERAQSSKTKTNHGIFDISKAHGDVINAVRFLSLSDDALPFIVSGSADKTIRLWQFLSFASGGLRCIATVQDHRGSVNCLSVDHSSGLAASGAADGTVKIWRISRASQGANIELLQNIELQPHFFPLALSLLSLTTPKNFVLAVGGTRSSIDLYTSSSLNDSFLFEWQDKLQGHDGWIRSLDIIRQPESSVSSFVLASASQDKYIRLWKIQRKESESLDGDGIECRKSSSSLSNKIHQLASNDGVFLVSFEALLLGHEDWIYSVRWNPSPGVFQLLSASADNSLVIWEPEAASGIWICKERLGEVSVQKGSTTATGSTGGFWIGLWSITGKSVVSLGRTGSWRKWIRDDSHGEWRQEAAISGHTKEVRDLTWSKSGIYLVSVSADQTARVHVQMEVGGYSYWAELARPQIHGYDINCVGAISDWQFVSGSDEKLLRVFDAPSQFATSLCASLNIQVTDRRDMPKVASLPVLGLSNKSESEATEEWPMESSHQNTSNMFLSLTNPPHEDMLSRHTLWPEHEKLYGHGFEISSVAVSHDASIIATACKATSIEHAVIRLYDTKTWHVLQPLLTAHSLTVTCLAFRTDDHMLLSCGRDRQWTVFEREHGTSGTFSPHSLDRKGHSRMILGGAWAPLTSGSIFGTASRDKSIKLWREEEKSFACLCTISTTSAVTSIDFCSMADSRALSMAAGLETGAVIIYVLDTNKLSVLHAYELKESISPSLAINRVVWQPTKSAADFSGLQITSSRKLAVASQDCSVRIIEITTS